MGKQILFLNIIRNAPPFSFQTKMKISEEINRPTTFKGKEKRADLKVLISDLDFGPKHTLMEKLRKKLPQQNRKQVVW